MQRTILLIALILLTSTAAVGGLSTWNLGRIARTVVDERESNGSYHRLANQARMIAIALPQAVEDCFQAGTDLELRESRDEVYRQADALTIALDHLGEQRYASVNANALPMVDAATVIETPSGTGDTAATRFGDLLDQLRTELPIIREAIDQSLVLAERRHAIASALGPAKDELSKTFRKGFALLDADAKAFGNFARGVIVTLSTTSEADLKFAGLSKFEDGFTALNQADLDVGQRASLDAIKAQFDTTYAIVREHLSSGTDTGFIRRRTADLQEGIGRLAEASEHAFDQGQDSLVDTAQGTIGSLLITGIGLTLAALIIGAIAIRRLIRICRNASTDLSARVDELSSTAAQLADMSSTLEQQAAGTAASLTQITASIASIAQMAGDTSQNTARAQAAASGSGRLIEQGLDAAADLDRAFAAITASNQEVTSIVARIESIAFQTNLLALNAAVEAARAGEAGAGFAVVADEVRRLAHQAAESAKSSTESIERSSEAIKRGVDQGKSTLEVIRSIASANAEVAEVVGRITTAAQAQTASVNEINHAVRTLDERTHQTVELARQGNAAVSQQERAVQDLHQESAVIAQLITRF